MEPTKRLFRPTLVIILIAVLVLVLAALGAYFYYFSSPGKYWHAKGQKSGAEATKKAEFNLNEAMRIVSENYAYSLVEQPLLDTTGNALSKTVVKKEEVVVFGKAKTFDWSFGLQFRQIHLIDQITFRPTGQGGWVTSASLVSFTSPKEAWEWGHREKDSTSPSVAQRAVTKQTVFETIKFASNQLWTNTNIQIPDSSYLTIKVFGNFLNRKYGNRVGPEGVGGTNWDTGSGPISQTHGLATFAKIDNGQPWLVSNNSSSFIIKGGQLYLGINDDILSDNEGSLNAEITIKTQLEAATQIHYSLPPSCPPLPLSKKHLEATQLGINEWEVTLSAKDGYGGTGVLVQPGEQVEISTSGQCNIGLITDPKELANRSTGPNGYIADWCRAKRKSFASWPSDCEQFKGLDYFGGAYARLGDYDTFKFTGSHGGLKNNYNQPLELQFAINDDFFFNEEVLYRWLFDNSGGYVFKFKLTD